MIDTGEGISPSKLKTLFSTFTNSKISVFKSQGVGIGLSTSKVLSNSLCGGVMLKSNVSKGTEVSFSVQVRDKQGEFSLEELRETSNELRNQMCNYKLDLPNSPVQSNSSGENAIVAT